MEEISRIIIEEYCTTHNSTKSKRLGKLVEMTYDFYADPSDADAIFLEKVIQQEKDTELKEALEDMDEFLFRY